MSLSGALAACGSNDDSGTSGGGGGGGGGRITLGFIALTDCASVVMASELGYFEDRGLDVEVLKQESWPATRDNLLNGQIDGAHALFSLPFSVATGIGAEGSPSTDLKIAMTLNNNGQAITLSNELEAAGYGDLDAVAGALEALGSPTLAMTFPGGTHDTWLRYWLMAAGVPFDSVEITPVPPPQMVQNMSVHNTDGYCVGEPWGAVAVDQGIGFTHITTQDIWEHHPEKALVVGSRLSEDPDTLKEIIGAVLQASEWLDDPDNRSEAAETLGQEHYVNAEPDAIRGRLTGSYELGADLGEQTFDGNQMKFFRDGLVNLPRRSYGYWFLSQYQRFGLLDEAPDYEALVNDIILSDLYVEAAEAEGVTVPDDDMAPFEVKLDGVTFDPANPEEEAART
jgi:nitrate/nitrite transport system substrate-binding protein